MKKNEYLIEQINKLLDLEIVKNQKKIKEDLLLINKRLSNKTFRIVVVGEFSSGKSTFINAMIGKDILKHASSETTATITHIINVSSDDERIGKCEIEFNNGKKEMTNTDMLKKYTTVNNDYDVANSIQSVSLYLHFLDVDHPFVISDTPGLNGIADKHRDITFEEIKKSHACIYLFSNNGVKLSDKDFLKIIMNYQSRFIFVQNFIDLLRVSEGETQEKKLSNDRELIQECIGDNNEIKYDIYGISAVKALAAKDISKDKVFNDDIKPISDRAALMKESNFQKFENGLADIINSGEYLDIICYSAVQALEHIFEMISSNLDAQQELNDLLRNSDDKEKRNKKIRTTLENFTEQIPTKRKAIDNFIQARDADNCNTLNEYLKNKLEDLHKRVTDKINNDIKEYEDFEHIEYVNRCTVPRYYSKYVSQIINSEIIPDINERAVNSLDHIYEEALLRVTKFVSSQNDNSKIIDINVVSQKADFDSKFRSEKEKIMNDKVQLETARNKYDDAQSAIADNERELVKQNEQINRGNNELDRIKSEGQRELNRLGRDPGVQKKAVERTRAVSRRGLWRIFDLFSTKYETYTDYVDDYTAQNEWKARKTAIQDRIDNNVSEQKRVLKRAEEKRRDLERTKETNEWNAAKYEADIKYLNDKIKKAEELYKESINRHKKEFCVAEKKRLIDEIHNAMLNKNNSDSTLCNMQNYIKQISDGNIKKITDRVIMYFDSSVQEKIAMLNGMINQNEEALKNQYELSKRESETLNDIRNKCKELLKNERIQT